MWIHSIRLRNFKSYDNVQFTFPEPKDGRNIILIGAQNGHGKTTLLEAVYLCLYDKDAVTHLQRAGLNSGENGYSNFLQSALHHQAASRFGQYLMELEIEIRQNRPHGQCGLRIRRKWHFDHYRKPTGEQETYIEISKDGCYEPVDEEHIGKYLNSYALPIDYAPFFFFDGEKIVQTAQQSGTGIWLNTALKGLLGITLLDKLRESLKSYRNKCISENASQKMQDDLEKAERALQTAQAALDVFQTELDQTAERWEERVQERDRLTRQLGGSTDIRTSQDLITLREKLEKETTGFEEKIKAAVQAMPLAFLPRGRLKTLQTQLEREKNRLNHEAGKNQIAQRVNDFWGAFVASDKVKEVLGRSAGMILDDPLMKEAVKDCWEELFYPLPADCAETIEHNYLSVNAHAEIQNEIASLTGMPQDKIGIFLAEIDKREDERKRIAAEIELLKGTDNDELVRQLKTANTEIDKLAEETGRLKSNVSQQSRTRDRHKDEVARLQDNISHSNPRLVKSQRAGNIDKTITRLTEELMKQKVGEVSEAATRINRSIAHDERIHKIRIENNGGMTLFGRDGCESRVDLSAGQMQILIMSLVSALAEVTRYHAPFIIDTPLARLDAGHREGLFRHWSSLPQQVILLSQDTEITPEVSRRLEAHTGRTYLVEAESLDSTGARSRVSPDVYFQ